MNRTTLALLLLVQIGLALAGCDTRRSSADPDAGAPVSDARPSGPDNAAAVTSIMRPAVTNEVVIAPPEPTPTPQPLAATIGFPNGGATLDDAARAALDALVADPRFAPGGAIILRGNSDSRGSDDANLAASRRRAEAVRAYLLEHGAAAERVSVVALGEARPIAPNANRDGSDFEEGRRRNRRVEIEVAPAPANPAGPMPAPTVATPL